MRKILALFMSGLVTVLPLALTVYVIWWLVNTVEGWLRRALIGLGLVSPAHYWPGLGLLAGFFLLLAVGSLVNAYAGRIFLKYWDDFLGRIPFVKTLYGAFRDVLSLLPSGSGEKRDLQRVVLANPQLPASVAEALGIPHLEAAVLEVQDASQEPELLDAIQVRSLPASWLAMGQAP